MVQAPAGQRSKLRRLGWDPKACIEDTRWHCTHPHRCAVWGLRRPLHSRASVVCGDKHEEIQSHSVPFSLFVTGRQDPTSVLASRSGNNANLQSGGQCVLPVHTVTFRRRLPDRRWQQRMRRAHLRTTFRRLVEDPMHRPRPPPSQPCETRPHAFRKLPHSNH